MADTQDGGTPAADDTTMFSRTGVHGPYGALVSELKTKVDIDLDLQFRRWCAERGRDPSAVLRNWINKELRGVSYDMAVAHDSDRRSAQTERKGRDEAPSDATATATGLPKFLRSAKS